MGTPSQCSIGTRRIVSLVLLWQVAASICYYAVFAATPFFRDEFGLSGAGVGLIVTSLTLGYATFLLPLGALTDRYGERRMLGVGLVGLSAGAVLVTVAWSYPTLLVAAFLLGSLYGTAIPGTNKAIFDNISEEHLNLAVGIKQVGVTAGSGISAVLVTGVAGVLFWEAGFHAAAGFGLLVALLFVLVYSGSNGAGRAEYPDFRVLARNGPYRALTAAGFFLGAGLFTTTGYTIVYIDEAVGASIAFGGLVLAALQVSGSVGRITTGWLGDVYPGDPRKRIGAILLAQTLAGTALFVVVAYVRSRLLTALAFVALGFFVLGFTGVYYSCMGTLVAPDEMGGATAGGQLALVAGALVAPPVFGYLADTVGYRASWLMLAGFGLVGAAFVLRVLRMESPRDTVAASV